MLLRLFIEMALNVNEHRWQGVLWLENFARIGGKLRNVWKLRSQFVAMHHEGILGQSLCCHFRAWCYHREPFRVLFDEICSLLIRLDFLLDAFQAFYRGCRASSPQKLAIRHYLLELLNRFLQSQWVALIFDAFVLLEDIFQNDLGNVLRGINLDEIHGLQELPLVKLQRSNNHDIEYLIKRGAKTDLTTLVNILLLLGQITGNEVGHLHHAYPFASTHQRGRCLVDKTLICLLGPEDRL